MQSLPSLLAQGNAWLFIPTAILLGALHGLEPGHSKTMMAAFIIAIRGTVGQAVLLGLSAAISHSLVVWIIALGGQYLGRNLDAATSEPYLQLASGIIVLCVGIWMIWRTQRNQTHEAAHGHDHAHHHHEHGADIRQVDTDYGVVALEVFEDKVPPRWRLRTESDPPWRPSEVIVVTERPDQSRQSFTFVDRGDYLESVEEIPEPHEFKALLSLSHDGHVHEHEVQFTEHDHGTEYAGGLKVGQGDYMDAHERSHADDITRRFGDRNVTTTQILLFGLTGGLIPCPAAITVTLPPAQADHTGCYPGAVFQRRACGDDGLGRCAGLAECQTYRQALVRVQYVCAARTLCLGWPDGRHCAVHGHFRLGRTARWTFAVGLIGSEF